MNNLVKIHNDLNQIQFKGFGTADHDFLMFLCAQMRDHNDEVMTFSYTEIKDVLGYERHATAEQFTEALDEMDEKLEAIKAIFKGKRRRQRLTLFPTFDADADTKTLTVRVNPDFKYIINELTRNFTQFELTKFVELSTKYSKTLYRLLRQYRSTGEYHVKVDELRKLLQCPETYPNKLFTLRVITPAVKELQKEFPLLKFEVIRARTQGRPVTGYHFTFEADGAIPGQVGIDEAAAEMKKYKSRKKAKYINFEQRQYDDEFYRTLERGGNEV